jgi:Rhodopirellula transposase DDE domain
MSTLEGVRSRYELLRPVMDERLCRLWAAAEARILGHGGISHVARATGMMRKRVAAGLRELEQIAQDPLAGDRPRSRIRRPGGGRKPLTQQDPTLLSDLDALVDPVTRGDPQSPLRWTCKSTAQLAAELRRQGHQVSERKVAYMLREQKYSLQANRKTQEGASHPDRERQFQHINACTQAFQQRGQPVVSVDTKKKELVGPFKNGGREWQPSGAPQTVNVHDFPDPELGKAIPYGVYDVTANAGWVSVGMDHDTAPFAVQSLSNWWRQMGREAYPEARELLVMADGGGSNGARLRLWKLALQRLADETGLRITVCHFPPGTSKWNKIEHRMFCHITRNWRGRPLVSHEVIVNLIGSTTTATGLTIRADLDPNLYPTGIRVTDDEMATVRIQKADFHGDWNYTVIPHGAPD